MSPPSPPLQLIVVTGLSGSGISTALNALEDLGWFCVDNLPPKLVPTLIEMAHGNQRFSHLALGLDARNTAAPDEVLHMLDQLGLSGLFAQVIFLEAADEALLRRFSTTRRPHPLAREGLNLPEAIRAERARMFPFRERAQLHLDTTHTTVHDCKRQIQAFANRGEQPRHLVTQVMSFGFRHGVPTEADIVWDVRFLPNPHFIEHLRPQSGLDEAVACYVLDQEPTQRFLAHFLPLLDEVLPAYEAEGKSRLTIAIGCTGGRHRSVAIAEHIAQHIHSREKHRAAQLTEPPRSTPPLGGPRGIEEELCRHRDIEKEAQ